MRKKVKSYFIFTSRLYRWVLFAIVPALLVMVQIVLHLDSLFLMTLINAIVYACAEILLDYWVFGGIAVKGGTQLEYIKTSGRGVGVIGTALSVDMVRQFFMTIVLLVANIVILVCQGGTIECSPNQIAIVLVLPVMAYFITVTELTIIRHLDSLQVNLLASYFVPFLFAGGIALAVLNAYVVLAVLVVLSIVSSILGVKLILKRVKESYYDRTA